jgi:hypothetical protein
LINSYSQVFVTARLNWLLRNFGDFVSMFLLWVKTYRGDFEMILAEASNFNLQLLHQKEDERQFSIVMKLLSKTATCPQCSSLSTRKHSRYTRILQDVPLDDKEASQRNHSLSLKQVKYHH